MKHSYYLAVLLIVVTGVSGTALAQQCTPPPPDMVAWWPFDGNTEDIVGGNDGVLIGDAAFTPGIVADAVDLDGNGDYVSIPDAPDLDLVGTDFAVDYWIKTTDTSAIHVKKYPGLGGPGWAIGQGGAANPGVAFWDGAGWRATGVSVVTGDWVHVAVVGRSALGQIRFFINGAPVVDLAFSPIAPSTAPIFIGTETAGTFPRDGMIDEVEIFHRALENAEVQAIFDAGSAGKCKSPQVPISSSSALFVLGVALLAGVVIVLVTARLRGRGYSSG